jgi:hypothetical protein
MATSNAALVFSTTSAGSLEPDILNERKLYGAAIELQYGYRDVYWTDDGTPSGNSLFLNTAPPFVRLLAMGITDRRTWSQILDWGAIWWKFAGWTVGPFSHDTEWDAVNGCWVTRVLMWGRVGTNYQEGGESSRVFVLGAFGK